METKSFAIVTVTTAEFPPRVCVSPFWEVEEDKITECVAATVIEHAETLECGALSVTVTEIAC